MHAMASLRATDARSQLSAANSRVNVLALSNLCSQEAFFSNGFLGHT
jgi:hypothetical protein